MNQYTLNFADPVQPRRRNRLNPWVRRRRYRAFYQILLLLSGLAGTMALVGLLRYRNQTQLLRERYQAQVIQYDSLLVAKVEADRQLQRLRIQLSK